jgi:hypothetical protein
MDHGPAVVVVVAVVPVAKTGAVSTGVAAVDILLGTSSNVPSGRSPSLKESKVKELMMA